MNIEDYKNQAVDLSKIAQERKAADQAAADAAMAEAQKVAIAWDKGMRRAFKGILPRPVGRAMLIRASERQA